MNDGNGHKPPAPPMESRQARSIRFNSVEWEAICAGARRRALEPAVFVRLLTMYGLSIAEAPTLAEAAAWMPRQVLPASPQALPAPPRTQRG